MEDFICCHNPLGFHLRQFVKPQHLLQHFGNAETKQVHSITSPRVVDVLIALFCCIFRENVLFPASVSRCRDSLTASQSNFRKQQSASAIFVWLLWSLVFLCWSSQTSKCCGELSNCTNCDIKSETATRTCKESAFRVAFKTLTLYLWICPHLLKLKCYKYTHLISETCYSSMFSDKLRQH